MGSGVSRHVRPSNELVEFTTTIAEHPLWADPDNVSRTEQMSIANQNFVHNSKLVCDICTESWNFIEKMTGQVKLCEIFFANFAAMDPDSCQLQCPRTRSTKAGNTRESLFLHIVHYMLDLQENTWQVRKQLRALGRKHVLYGIERRHVEVFNRAFLTTIASIPCHLHLAVSLRCWSSLLSFVIEQMFFENIKLVHHVTKSSCPVEAPEMTFSITDESDIYSNKEL